jgi:hypothetical protein
MRRIFLILVKVISQCRSLFSLALVFSAVPLVQLDSWYTRNGFTFHGECINHFGEIFSCSLPHWLIRPFSSPFAWPALILGYFLIWFSITSLLFFLHKVWHPDFSTTVGAPRLVRIFSRLLGVILFAGVAIVWLYGFIQ